MKKMIFSAVALVAFSFAGMANEIEEKKVETVEMVKDCCAVSDAAFDSAVDAGIHWSKAQFIALAAYNACNKLNQ